MSNEYCENKLIQGSAAKLLQDTLGWEVVYAYNNEVLGENGDFGRKSYKEVLLPKYFAQALKKLNTWITDKQIAEAKTILESHLSTASLLEINEEKYKLIKDGVQVTAINERGEADKKTAVPPCLTNNVLLRILIICRPDYGRSPVAHTPLRLNDV